MHLRTWFAGCWVGLAEHDLTYPQLLAVLQVNGLSVVSEDGIQKVIANVDVRRLIEVIVYWRSCRRRLRVSRRASRPRRRVSKNIAARVRRAAVGFALRLT
jgi:hypothetical protein